MTQDEIIEMARHIADMFGTRMCDEHGDTHGEELYAMGIDDIVETIKLVAAKEREACDKCKEQGEPIGVMVSMDVSKGDEPEHRIFGRIYEVQEDDDGVTYLAIEDHRNFDTTQPKQEQGEPLPSAVLRTLVNVDKNGIETWKDEPLYTKPQLLKTMTDEQPKEPKQEQGEPAVTDWSAVHQKLELVWYKELSPDEGLDEIQDLIYTTPPQRKPLTDEQIWKNDEIMAANSGYGATFETLREVVRATEAAHYIKENT